MRGLVAEGGESSESGEPVGHRYRRFELIGSGAMGAVYRGEDREGRDLAVKILRSEFSSDSLILSRFMQERALMVRLVGDGIVKVVDFVAEGEMLAIVMERITGGSLRDLMVRDRQSISQSMAIQLLADVAAGLATAHAAGVIHRDIKPENVLIDDAGERPVALVTDFGISGLTEGSAHTRMTSLVGTPQYMAPELINGDVASPAVDVYAAGIMLYELLSGKTPFAGGHVMATLKRHVDELPQRIEGLTDALWFALESTLAKRPEERPSAADFHLRLVGLLEAEGSLVASPDSSSFEDDLTATVLRGSLRNRGDEEGSEGEDDVESTILRSKPGASPPRDDAVAAAIAGNEFATTVRPPVEKSPPPNDDAADTAPPVADEETPLAADPDAGDHGAAESEGPITDEQAAARARQRSRGLVQGLILGVASLFGGIALLAQPFLSTILIVVAVLLSAVVLRPRSGGASQWLRAILTLALAFFPHFVGVFAGYQYAVVDLTFALLFINLFSWVLGCRGKPRLRALPVIVVTLLIAILYSYLLFIHYGFSRSFAVLLLALGAVCLAMVALDRLRPKHRQLLQIGSLTALSVLLVAVIATGWIGSRQGVELKQEGSGDIVILQGHRFLWSAPTLETFLVNQRPDCANLNGKTFPDLPSAEHYVYRLWAKDIC